MFYNAETSEYRESVVTSNYACSSLCADLVARPRDESEVVSAIQYARGHNMSVSIKGGGHSYACSSVKCGGLLIDMLHFTSLSLDTASRVVDIGILHFFLLV